MIPLIHKRCSPIWIIVCKASKFITSPMWDRWTGLHLGSCITCRNLDIIGLDARYLIDSVLRKILQILYLLFFLSKYRCTSALAWCFGLDVLCYSFRGLPRDWSVSASGVSRLQSTGIITCKFTVITFVWHCIHSHHHYYRSRERCVVYWRVQQWSSNPFFTVLVAGTTLIRSRSLGRLRHYRLQLNKLPWDWAICQPAYSVSSIQLCATMNL